VSSKEAFIVVEAAQTAAIVAVVTGAGKTANCIDTGSVLVAGVAVTLVDVLAGDAIAAKAVLALALKRAMNVDAFTIGGAVFGASSGALINIGAHESVAFESGFAETRIRPD